MYKCIQIKADLQLKTFFETKKIKYAVLITPKMDTLVIIHSKRTSNLSEIKNYPYEKLEFIPTNISNPLN